MGRIIGRLALEKGARCLVIWDINEKNIASTVSEYSSKGNVKGYKVDVSNNEMVCAVYDRTVSECGDIDILINCAGIVTSNKTFDKLTVDEITRTMNINAIAPMLVSHCMIGRMIERNRGHICTITSAGGLLSTPKMTAYTASKWSSTGWSDSMRIELHDMKSNVRVTTLAPYYVNTGMFEGVSSKIFPILDPEKTSRKMVRAIEKDKTFCGIPFGFHFCRACEAVLPTKIFDYVFGEVFGIYHAMDHFTGRK